MTSISICDLYCNLYRNAMTYTVIPINSKLSLFFDADKLVIVYTAGRKTIPEDISFFASPSSEKI